jgi:hypothetical protein
MNSPSEMTIERRANLARLSMCLLLSATIALLFAVSVAQAAAPPVPSLTRTDPTSSEASPATTTTPLVLGEAEPENGVITEVVTSSEIPSSPGRRLTAMHPTKHPTYEISIFIGPDCEEPLATGSAEALEATGIPVSAPANAETTFSARQVDPADPTHPSSCSNPLSYWEGNPPPGESSPGGGAPGAGGPAGPPVVSAGPVGTPDAPRLHTNPGGRSNDGAPLVAGSAPGAATVLVFADGTCSGVPVVKGPADRFSAGFEVHVADNATTSFSAISVADGRSACSASVSYVEDSIPPHTRITMAPGVKTRKHKAVFRFADTTEDPPGTTFFCKVNRGKWEQCSSPLRLRHLHVARYVVRVRAIDIAGNVETVGAKRLFKVVRSP